MGKFYMPSGGDMRPYTQRRHTPEYDQQVKQPERDLVAKHILLHHSAPQMRLLSFPANSWRFERALRRMHCEPVQFIAVEKSDKIIRSCVAGMPGGAPQPVTIPYKGYHVDAWENATATVVHEELLAFAPEVGVFQDSKQSMREWQEKYGRWTAVWLDTMTHMSGTVLRLLRMLARHCENRLDVAPTIPVVITLNAQRESLDMSGIMLQAAPRASDSYEQRAVTIQKVFNQYSRTRSMHVENWRTYMSGKAKMLTINTILIPRG